MQRFKEVFKSTFLVNEKVLGINPLKREKLSFTEESLGSGYGWVSQLISLFMNQFIISDSIERLT